MSLLLALLQLLLILYITYTEYQKKSIGLYLWGMLTILFGVMHLQTVWINDSDDPRMWVYDTASIFVIFFCIIYILTGLFFHIKPIRIFKFKNDKLERFYLSKTEDYYLKCTFIILIFSAFYKIYSFIQFTGSIWNTSWSNGRDYSASLDYMNFNQVATLLFYFSSSAILLFFYWGKKKMAIISSSIVLFMVLISRNRMDILPILCSLIAYYVYRNSKLTTKLLFQLLILAISSVIIIYALQIFRYYGTIDTFIKDFQFDDFYLKIFRNIDNGKGDIGLREWFYFFIERDNDFSNFGKGHSYLRMIMILIPTEWSLGLKPPDFAISMGQAIGMAKGGSTHPTLFGDCYANFGFIGFLMGIFWSWFVNFLNKLISNLQINQRISMTIIFGTALIIIGRGSVYNAFWIAFFSTIVMFCISYIVKRSTIKKISIIRCSNQNTV